MDNTSAACTDDWSLLQTLKQKYLKTPKKWLFDGSVFDLIWVLEHYFAVF